MNKHLIWAITIFSIVAMICGTLIWINYNSWTLRFEMDDNTKEAIESLDWKEITKVPLYYNIDDNETIYILEDETFKEVEILNDANCEVSE